MPRYRYLIYLCTYRYRAGCAAFTVQLLKMSWKVGMWTDGPAVDIYRQGSHYDCTLCTVHNCMLHIISTTPTPPPSSLVVIVVCT